MTERALHTLAAAFLHDYTDPEIDKRLFFDVWSDRSGHGAELKRALWQEVKRISRRHPRREAPVVGQGRDPSRAGPAGLPATG